MARVVNRQAEQLAAAQREIKRLQVEVLSFEAQQLGAQAELFGVMRLVTRLYPNRSINELRGLAKQLPAQDNLVAVLAGYEGQKLSLVVSCADGINARELLAHYLVHIDGKGSGDARLARGSGNASPEQVTQLLAQMRAFLESKDHV